MPRNFSSPEVEMGLVSAFDDDLYSSGCFVEDGAAFGGYF